MFLSAPIGSHITNNLIQMELQSADCKSFDSDRDFGARIANHLIQIGTSERVSLIIWFRSELRSAYCKSFDSDLNAYHYSFDSDRNFGVRIANHLIQIGTSERVSLIIWFRSELRSAYCKSFDSDRNFGACIANHLIQIGTSERVSQIIWFRLGLWSMYR